MEDSHTLIITIIGYVFGAGGLLFWFLERRKFNAEVEAALEGVNSSKIDNDVKLSHHYKELLDDLKKRYEERYKEFEKVMSDRIQLQKDEITLLKRQLRNMKTLVKDQEKELKEKDNIIKSLANGNSTK